MKTFKTTLFTLCLLLPIISYAQSKNTTKKAELFVGAILNYNTGKLAVSEFSYYNNADFSSFTHLGGGAILQLKMKKGVFLQTELTYSKKSVADNAVNVFPFSDEEISADVEFNFSYLNYPMMIGYSFTKKSLKPYIATGLHLGWALKKEVIDIPNTDLPSWKNPATSPSLSFESIQFGLILEAGIRKELSNRGMLTANIRYTGSEVTYKVGTNASFGAGAANLASRRVSLSMGYLLKIGKE